MVGKNVESNVVSNFYILSSSEIDAVENVALNGWKVMSIEIFKDETKDSNKFDYEAVSKEKELILVIYFNSGKHSAVIDKRTVSAIKQLNPEKRYYLYGHTDSVPVTFARGYSNNYALSIKRTEFVKNYILTVTNISSSKIKVAGFGALRPAHDNTVEGMSKNRRVELYEGY